MAIRLPGISEQLNPAMDGIRRLMANIANPNYQQQAALREALLAGRIDPQTLVDMGPEEVERRFGKGTAHYASGNKSLKSRVEGLKGEEIQNILKLPENDPKRQEFIAQLTGIKDPTERKLGQQNIQRNEQVLAQGQREQQEAERRAAARITVNEWRMKSGNPDNIYVAKMEGKMPGPVLAAIMEHDETKDEYLSQQRDYWAKIEDEYRNKALNERIDPAKAVQEHNIINARKIADQSNMSNVEDILMVLKDRELEKTYAGDTPPTTPAQKRIWDAVQAVRMSRKMESDDRKRTALEYFRKQTAGISSIFRDEKRMAQLGEAGILAQVDLYNKLAQQVLGGYYEAKDIPQIAFDEKGPRSKDAGWFAFDKKTLYQTSGVPAFEDTSMDQSKRAPSVDPIEAIAQEIISGRANLDEQMKMAPDAASANRLKVRVEQLRAERVRR